MQPYIQLTKISESYNFNNVTRDDRRKSFLTRSAARPHYLFSG